MSCAEFDLCWCVGLIVLNPPTQSGDVWVDTVPICELNELVRAALELVLLLDPGVSSPKRLKEGSGPYLSALHGFEFAPKIRSFRDKPQVLLLAPLLNCCFMFDLVVICCINCG